MLYASVQGSYKLFEIALFEDEHCFDIFNGGNVQASSQFLSVFDKLLQKNNRKFDDFSFLAINKGPGAFTSLRVIISTVNALAFSESPSEGKIKLVGVDGIDALAQETLAIMDERLSSFKNLFLVSLLNAYNNEVYYGIYKVKTQPSATNEAFTSRLDLCEPKGYKKIDLFLSELIQKYCGSKSEDSGPFIFTGNGAKLHEDAIRSACKTSAKIIEPYAPLLVCSAKQIGKMGLDLWNRNQNVVSEIKPLYLKSQRFAIKKEVLTSR